MQLAVLEYARNVLGLKEASTEEIDPKAKDLVVHVMDDQRQKVVEGDYGGTMRLGAYQAVLKAGTIARAAYKQSEIVERHRHRYEINNAYVERLTERGVVFSGASPDGHLMEIMELPKTAHPFFVGVQFHPEFLARPLLPHPLFTAFIKAAYEAK
jgi:CTP synthase